VNVKRTFLSQCGYPGFDREIACALSKISAALPAPVFAALIIIGILLIFLIAQVNS